ncbi:MAG: translation elongation factor Ts [Solirubrobacteraceae bacterium]
MSITAADVSKLRNTTGAGMMDCKKALTEADGDFEKAIEILRKKGQKVAANRADRDSSEGIVVSVINAEKTKGVVFSLNCETDFVAKNEDFIKLANSISNISINCSTKEELLNSDFNGLTVHEKLIEQTGVIGEKIEIGSFKLISGNYLGTYIHAGSKIGTIVALSLKEEEVGRNIAMQIAAMNPLALDESAVDSSVIEKELEIAKDQLRQEGKPEEMLENIAKGKLKKFFKDNTLLFQDYIKAENKESVNDYLKSIDSNLKISGFIRVGI